MVFERVAAGVLSLALLAGPALAEPDASAAKPPTALSGVTVTTKPGAVDPQLKCADQACVLSVLKLLKSKYPREYENLMRWCMANDSQRMAVASSGLVGSGGQVDTANPSVTPSDSSATSASSNEQLVCDDRYRK